MASSAGEGTSYEGVGVGGKFRKRPFRKPSSTPYDRPSTALRKTNTDGGWLSKIITPASKLVSSSAQLFFSSLLRKRIASTPQRSQPEAGRESIESVQEAVQICPRVDQSDDDRKCSPDTFDGSGFSELENTLKQRTFTRSEINHLMGLLHSRTNELPDNNKDKRAETSHGLPMLPSVVLDKVAGSPVTEMRGGYLESQKAARWISSPVTNPHASEENVSSPVELAKAYMGNRASEVSPSMLRLRGQVHKEDAMLRTIVPFSPKTSTKSLARSARSTGRASIPENGFITPRSLGRSAIYNMARTPYSKVHPASSQKTLKRRSVMEEDDYGSIGPIRRIRQKTNLSTTNSLNRFGARTPLAGSVLGVDSDVNQDPSSSSKAILSLDEPGSRNPLTVGKSWKGIHGTNYTSVPSKSTAVATKILEQLDKLVPKEQSSPQAKSVMTVKSQDTLQGFQDPQTPGSFSNATSRKPYRVEENGQALPLEKTISTSIKRVSPVSESFFQPLNKSGFQMSALEHTWDVDGNGSNETAARKSVTEGKGKLEDSVARDKIFPTNVLRLGKSPLSGTKSPVSPETQKTGGFGSEKIVASNGAAHPPASTSHLNDTKVSDTAPLPSFSFGFKHVDKVPFPQFSMSSPVAGTSNTAKSSPSDIKVASPNSSGPSDSMLQISASDKGKNVESTTAEVMSKSVPLFSNLVPASTGGATNIFGFSNGSDKLSNGDNKNTEAAAVPTSSSAANSIFTFSNLANKSDSVDKKNALVATTEATVQSFTSASSAIPTSTSSIFPESKPVFGNGFVASSSSTMGFSTSSAPGSSTNGFSQTPISFAGSTPNGATNAVTTPSTSLFKFGGAPSTSTASEPVLTDLKSKNEKKESSTVGNNIFGSSSQHPGSWPAAETKSTPFQFGGSSTAFGNNSGMNPTTNSPFNSSSQNVFSSSMGGVGANNSSTASMFGSSTGFAFGQSNSSSAATTASSSPMGFGSVFSFQSTTANASSSQALPTANTSTFGSSFQAYANPSTNNGDQMNMDSSMNEDTVQSSYAPSSLPVFSQQPSAASPFQFGSTSLSSAQPSNPFQFGQAAPSNPQPPSFLVSGGSEFSGGGGSFSLGAGGGGDKSNRKIIRVKHKNRKK